MDRVCTVPPFRCVTAQSLSLKKDILSLKKDKQRDPSSEIGVRSYAVCMQGANDGLHFRGTNVVAGQS